MITLKAMPFDSNEIMDETTGETYYDRVAYSRDLAEWMSTYFANGILVKGGNVLGDQLKVEHKEALTVTVNVGGICINGRTGWVEDVEELQLSIGSSLPRIDRIVAELNIPNDRGIYIKVLEGIPAETPEPPTLTQTDDVYQIPLAQCRIESAMAVIESVTDERQENISNVTIGIKPPTGMDAETVKVSDETAAALNLGEGEKNVDKGLNNTYIAPSYLAFCSNANVNFLNAAFGMNNEHMVRGLGKALALYARFKNSEVDIEESFPTLWECETLDDILFSQAFKEILVDANLPTLMGTSTYVKNKITALTQEEWQRIYPTFDLPVDILTTITADDAYWADAIQFWALARSTNSLPETTAFDTVLKSKVNTELALGLFDTVSKTGQGVNGSSLSIPVNFLYSVSGTTNYLKTYIYVRNVLGSNIVSHYSGTGEVSPLSANTRIMKNNPYSIYSQYNWYNIAYTGYTWKM